MAPTFTPLAVKLSGFLLLTLGLLSCNNKKDFYKSDCDDGRTFTHVNYARLINNMAYYDNQYVEVSGEYQQGQGLSALFNDGMFVNHTHKKALWVEFGPDCPLYLSGTRIGFFDYDYNDGKLTPVSNKIITLHGRINYHNKGYLGAYEGSIEHISYVKL